MQKLCSFFTIKNYYENNNTALSSKEKASLYNKFLHDNDPYFKGAAYEDAKQLSSTIDTIRSLILDNEEIKSKILKQFVFIAN